MCDECLDRLLDEGDLMFTYPNPDLEDFAREGDDRG